MSHHRCCCGDEPQGFYVEFRPCPWGGSLHPCAIPNNPSFRLFIWHDVTCSGSGDRAYDSVVQWWGRCWQTIGYPFTVYVDCENGGVPGPIGDSFALCLPTDVPVVLLGGPSAVGEFAITEIECAENCDDIDCIPRAVFIYVDECGDCADPDTTDREWHYCLDAYIALDGKCGVLRLPPGGPYHPTQPICIDIGSAHDITVSISPPPATDTMFGEHNADHCCACCGSRNDCMYEVGDGECQFFDECCCGKRIRITTSGTTQDKGISGGVVVNTSSGSWQTVTEYDYVTGGKTCISGTVMNSRTFSDGSSCDDTRDICATVPNASLPGNVCGDDESRFGFRSPTGCVFAIIEGAASGEPQIGTPCNWYAEKNVGTEFYERFEFQRQMECGGSLYRTRTVLNFGAGESYESVVRSTMTVAVIVPCDERGCGGGGVAPPSIDDVLTELLADSFGGGG